MNSEQKRKTVTAVIPARLESTRFPKKVLADLNGKPLIQWAYENASKAELLDNVIVAVDDKSVFKAVEDFGGKAVMTKKEHPSGTDRIHEAVQNIAADIIINIQGDEPFIKSSVINKLASEMIKNSDLEMATVAVPCRRQDIASDPNIVKLVTDSANFAIYFSRSAIPYLREGGTETELLKHWGIYAYSRNTLNKFVKLEESKLEKSEKLEQLRAVENGIKIFVLKTSHDTIGIDTKEDLKLAEKILAEKQNQL